MKISLRKRIVSLILLLLFVLDMARPIAVYALTAGPTSPEFSSFESSGSTDMVDLLTGDLAYNVPLLNIPGPEGGYPINLAYHAGIKNDQEASWVGLGWTLNPGAINRYVNGVPDDNKSTTEDYVWETIVKDGPEITGYDEDGRPIVSGGPRGSGYNSLSSSSYNTNVNRGVRSGVSKTYYDYSKREFHSQSEISKSWGVLYSREGASNSSLNPVANESITQHEGDFLPIQDIHDGVDLSEADPLSLYGGSIMAKDNYVVAAEGLSGQIAPFFDSDQQVFRSIVEDDDNTIYRNTIPDKDKSGTNSDLDPDEIYSNKPYFRFVGELSNSKFKSDDVFSSGGRYYTGVEGFLYESNYKNKVGKDGNSAVVMKNGELGSGAGIGEDGYYKPSKRRLTSAKHIEYFTEQEIIDLENNNYSDNPKGFIDFSTDRQRERSFNGNSADVTDRVTAIQITNENGVTYHFSKPVFNFIYETATIASGQALQTVRNHQVYAYTWLLTAITGADFLDKGVKGAIDEEDLGYWIKFNYGTWSQNYTWRNPGTDYNKDQDANIKTYSYGVKQVCYLDAISTRTHTALFSKSLRNDCKGATEVSNGDFEPVFDELNTSNIEMLPTPSLKLDEVYLFTNNNLYKGLSDEFQINNIEALKTLGSEYDYTSPTGTVADGDAVLDKFDLQQLSASLKKKALKTIRFNYATPGSAEELAKGIPNSFEVDYENYQNLTINDVYQKTGKLTLLGYEILGEGQTSIMPASEFSYMKNKNYNFENYDKYQNYFDFSKEFDANKSQTQYKRNPRYVTEIHAKDKDAWCLSQVKTPLGSTINFEYESDSYSTSVFDKKFNLSIEEIERVGTDFIELKIFGDPDVLKQYITPEEVDELNGGPAVSYANKTRFEFHGLFNNRENYVNEHGNNVCGFAKKEDVFIDDITLEAILMDGTVAFYSPELNQWMEDQETLSCSNGFQFVAANIFGAKAKNNIYADGIRVKSLCVSDGALNYCTEFDYQKTDPGNGESLTTGYITYEPVEMNVNIIGTPLLAEDIKTLNDKCYQLIQKPISLQHFVMGPKVLYQHVKVKKVTRKNDGTLIANSGYSEYEFTMPSESDVEYPVVDSGGDERHIGTTQYTNGPSYTDYLGNFKVYYIPYKSKAAKVGLLKKVDNYSSKGQPLTTNEKVYLHDLPNANAVFENEFNKLGRFDQTCSEIRLSKKNNVLSKDLIVTQVTNIPTFLVKEKVTNHTTGIINTVSYLNFDFLTGKPLSTVSEEAAGNLILTEELPAYTIYPETGFKIENNNYQNRLMASVEHKTYRVTTTSTNNYITYSNYVKQGLINANVSILDNNIDFPDNTINPNLWTPKTQYVYEGEPSVTLTSLGDYPVQSFDEFNFGNPDNNTGWVKGGATTLIDAFGNQLEQVDFNGIYSASRNVENSTLPLITGTDAQYEELIFAPVEYASSSNELECGVSANQGTVSLAWAHTGKQSLLVSAGNTGFSKTIQNPFTNDNRDYKACVWIYAPNLSSSELDQIDIEAELNGQTYTAHPTIQSGSWFLAELIIKNVSASSSFEVKCVNNTTRAVYFDDFKITPLNAVVSVSVYDPDKMRLSHSLDNNHFYKYYEYDNAGDVKKVFKEIPGTGKVLVTENHKNYEGAN